jgi:hypothetical protein
MRDPISPSPEWYEPADILDDDDFDPLPAPEPAEVFHIAAGAVSWTRQDDDTDD